MPRAGWRLVKTDIPIIPGFLIFDAIDDALHTTMFSLFKLRDPVYNIQVISRAESMQPLCLILLSVSMVIGYYLLQRMKRIIRKTSTPLPYH